MPPVSSPPMHHCESVRIDPREVASVIDALKRMVQELQTSAEPESLDVRTQRRSILSIIAELETLHLS